MSQRQTSSATSIAKPIEIQHMKITSQIHARSNRHRPKASAPSRGKAGTPRRHLSAEELELVLGVLVGTNLEISSTSRRLRPSARHTGYHSVPPHPDPHDDLLKNQPENLPERSAEIVQLARYWAPYGGPPEDEIYVRFGICRACFLQRLAEINARRG